MLQNAEDGRVSAGRASSNRRKAFNNSPPYTMSQLEAPAGLANAPQKPDPHSNAAPIDDLIADDLAAVNQQIQLALKSDVALINQMGHYIIGAGGKRLRPKLVLLSALAQGYQGKHHTNIAAVIEFIHTATLLHDDVVDSSSLRRGRETANTVWGNEAAVLVGDFLYSRSFEMMVEVGQMRVMEILSSATNTIAAGEVMQLMNIGEAQITVERYMEVIAAKTGKLFEAATQLGSVLAGATADVEQSMASYGARLGLAFQLVDDALDYTAKSDELGKNAGDDLAEGKPTLPLIFAMQTSSGADVEKMQKALLSAQENGQFPESEIQPIVDIVCQSGAIARTAELAQQQVDLAIQDLSELPGGAYKDALVAVAEASVKRRF